MPTVAEVLERAREVGRLRAQREVLRPPMEWAERHPVAALLVDAAPSLALVQTLVDLVPADVDDAGLVEMTAAWERVLSWATAAQSRTVAEMLRRTCGPREEGFLADEIAAATGVTPRAGRVLVDRAAALVRAPDVHDNLADGTLTTRKADTLCRVTAHLPVGQAAVVRRAVLAHGSRLTAPQIRATARRVELEIAPEAAAGRHEAARRTRGVWMEPADDCMAYVHAYLPATDAMRVMTAVDAVAAAAAQDDGRGVDARRADAMVDVLARVLDRGVGPDGVDLPVSQRRRPHLNVTLNVSTLLGLRDDPAVLAGYGPIGAQMAREVAAQGTWRFTLVDPRTGEVLERASKGYRPSPTVVSAVVDRAPTCTFPGCGVAASWCDIDHITPYDHARRDEVQTRTSGLHPLCRHHHVMKTHGRWSAERDPATGVTTWRSRTGQVYTRDPVAVPFEPGPPSTAPTERTLSPEPPF
ncbi:HNH endonuclease signature motif containing protein [Actinotalea sp. Marseille-Q4924]|uniref:HNH endonuclease signature motif containing protein n=1 Tax=Actinotalea sp. Marseille-Q4924 TaxID=2866571 RepID=UPI001CE3F7DC|nr:HNH endonuclease signature motif containing protein [Actinotalea sp. Marseille-Q4924]